MRRTTAILLGQLGQSITLRVPQGRPSSATFAVVRNYGADEATAEFSGAATISAVNTTTSAAAGQGQSDPQTLALASTAGILTEQRYLLAQNGVTEWVDVLEVGASSIRARFPLQHAYAIGATFVGTHATAAIDDAWIVALNRLSDLADLTPDYRVKWTLVVGGKNIFTYSFFDVVRSDVRHHVELADVNERAFGLVDSMPIEYREQDGRPIIDGAWRAVRADLIAQGISPESWRDDEALDELVVLRTLRHIAEAGWSPPSVDLVAYIKMTQDNYDRFFERHIVTLKHKTSVDLDAMTNPYAPAPNRAVWSK